MLRPWLVSSVTRTALGRAGFAVVTNASCASPPTQRWEFLPVSGLQTFSIMHPYLQKKFEHAPPMYIVIYKLYTGVTEILVFLPATQGTILRVPPWRSPLSAMKALESQEAGGTSVARSPLHQAIVSSSFSFQFFF